MNRLILCLALSALLVTIGCGGGVSGSNDYDVLTDDSAGGDSSGVVVTITGTVNDISTSLPLPGVTVTAPGAAPVTTDDSGSFTLEVTSGTDCALRATKEGYAAKVELVTLGAALTEGLVAAASIAMMPVAATAKIDPAEGGTVADVSGAQVTFPANGFVTKDGDPVTDEVTVNITPINPFDPVQLQAFPGSFKAINAKGEPGLMQSYSLMDISATAGGVDLTLAEGTTATVFFPIQDGIDAPETIGLWSLDETTGIWREEGTATRRALEGRRYYEAEITHLSSWNCDGFNGQTVEVKGTIVSKDAGLSASLKGGIYWHARGKSQNYVASFSGGGSTVEFVAQMPASDFVALQIHGQAGSTSVTFSSNAFFTFTPASGTVTLGEIAVVPDSCPRYEIMGMACVIDRANCNGTCINSPYFCIPGLDPKHPCATNNGGCLNGRACVEAPAADANDATLWSCGDCPSGKVALGLLDCQKVTCAISRGFCDDNATCTDSTTGVVCTCQSGYFGEGHSCSAWSTCGAGQHVLATGTATVDRTCTACEAGTFSATSNAASCTAWSSCTAGKYISAAGTASADRVCTACATGTFSTTTNAASCKAWTSCTAGQHVATAGTASTDRTCTACEDGTFSTTANAATCTAWTPCAETQYEAKAGSATKDRTCAECQEGYQGDGTACVPSCKNVLCSPDASCTAPNTCTCNEGYSGNGSTCTPLKSTTIDIAGGLTGNTTWNWASTDSVRAVEFYLGSMVSLTGVTVNGLPPDKAGTARMWVKTGAVNLQVTDTFPLGTPYSPTATTASSATFKLATPKQIGFATYSIVIAVADTDQGYQWEMLQFYNNAPSVTVDSITLESVWGWRGNVNVDTNTATDVSIYDNYMVQIPKVTLSLSN